MLHNDDMRTTVNIADTLLIGAKKMAAEKRTSLAFVIEESLRRYLAEKRQTKVSYSNKIPILSQAKPRAGILLDDTSALEHNCEWWTTDKDFLKFKSLRWKKIV